MSAFFIGHPSEPALALFAGGELGPVSRWRIERHLETCSACKSTVADFFHLREEISPLAELPDLDWSAMAGAIEQRVAAEAVPAAPPVFAGRAWPYGLAAACAIAIVAVAVRSPSTQPVAEPTAEVASLESAADLREKASAVESEEAAATSADRAIPAAEDEARSSQRRRFVQPAPASEQAEAAFSDSAPAPEGQETRELAESVGDRDAAAPGESVAAVSAPRAALASRAAGPALTQPRERQPLNPEARRTLDGAFEIRAVSADGILTITEIYAE